MPGPTKIGFTLKYFENSPAELYKTFTIVSKPLIEKEYLKKRNVNFTARDIFEPNHYLRFDNEGRIIFTGENTKFTQKIFDKKYMNNLANEKVTPLIPAASKIVLDNFHPIPYI